MKKILIFILLFAFCFTFAQADEIGKRYLKLGNSYREAGDTEKASEFLKKGLLEVSKLRGFEKNYWTAVANEYYGYLYRDLGMQAAAKDYFSAALNSYSQIISQDDGSPFAMQKIIETMSNYDGDGSSVITGCTEDFIQIATNFFANKNYSAAIRNYTNAINCGQMPDLAYFMRGKSQQMLGNKAEAAKDYAMSSSLNSLFSNIGNAIIWNDLDDALDNANDVYFLNLDNQGIEDLPLNDLKKLKNLVNLSMNNNALRELPDSIGELQKLQVISLEANPLEKMPSDMTKLSNLKELNLRYVYLPPNEVVRIAKELPKETRIIFE